jgi:hypothetical protein
MKSKIKFDIKRKKKFYKKSSQTGNRIFKVRILSPKNISFFSLSLKKYFKYYYFVYFASIKFKVISKHECLDTFHEYLMQTLSLS